MLPKTYTTPGFFEEKDLESLPKTVRDEAGEHRDSIQNSFSGLVNFLDQISQDVAYSRDIFSYDAFRWAWSAVNTRCVYMKQPPNPHLSTDEDHYALAPFLDLLNHSPHVQVNLGVHIRLLTQQGPGAGGFTTFFIVTEKGHF